MRLSMPVQYGTFFAPVEGLAHIFHACALALGFVIMAMMPAAAQGSPVGTAAVPASTAAPGKPIRLVAFGDSLTAGHGISAAIAFPARLQKALKARGVDVDIKNAGVSGDTTSGGLARLDWSIPDGTEGVILELGANDALRGIDPAIPRAALTEMLTRLKARNIPVLLCGMLAPPNYGAEYAAKFNAIYPDLAKAFDVPLYPFFLEGVAGDSKFNQGDGIHPTAEGVDVIVENIMPDVEAFLQTIVRRRG